MAESNDNFDEIFCCPKKECTVVLKCLYDKYGAETFLGKLAEALKDTRTPTVIEKLADFVNTYFSQSPRPIRTIGIYYSDLSIGGIQRVITTQFQLFHELGLRVVFFRQQPKGNVPLQKSYLLPDYVKQVDLPLLSTNSPTIREDIAKTASLIRAEGLDVFYSHDAYHWGTIVWLPLILKTAVKIPYFLHYHNVFSKMLVIGKASDFSTSFNCLKMADLLISLSNVNQLYFSLSGINTRYISNTYLLPELQVQPRKQAAGHTILYLARINFLHKRPLDAVRIMENVINRLPDAKLQIVGGGQKQDEKILQETIAESPAAEQIEFCGPTLDVASFYQRADVFIMTSSHEGFPVTLLEAQAFGLPVVSYDMPYLEIMRQSPNGILTVPQEDIVAASDAIVNVLTDPGLYHEKSFGGIANAKYFSEMDLKGAWNKIFTNWQDLSGEKMNGDEFEILLSTMRLHNYWSAQLHKRENQKLKRKLQKIEKSFSHRLGRALTWFPRKIRRGIHCLKEHGFVYTLQKIYQKIVRKITEQH